MVSGIHFGCFLATLHHQEILPRRSRSANKARPQQVEYDPTYNFTILEAHFCSGGGGSLPTSATLHSLHNLTHIHIMGPNQIAIPNKTVQTRGDHRTDVEFQAFSWVSRLIYINFPGFCNSYSYVPIYYKIYVVRQYIG